MLTALYVRDVSICRFWYLQGSLNQSSEDTQGQMNRLLHLFSSKLMSIHQPEMISQLLILLLKSMCYACRFHVNCNQYIHHLHTHQNYQCKTLIRLRVEPHSLGYQEPLLSLHCLIHTCSKNQPQFCN